jgi:hypothetical protein
LQLRTLHTQSRAAEEGEKRNKLIDAEADQFTMLSEELPKMIEKFKRDLNLGTI